MKIVETNRLMVEEATVEDGTFFYALLNSPTWLTHIGNRNIASVEDAVQYVFTHLIKSYRDNGFGLYKLVLKETGEPIGICGFVKRNYLSNADLGFALLPAYEGFGYAYEAAAGVLHYGINELSLQPVLAVTSEQNIRSQRLLRKLGFISTGTVQPDADKPAWLLYSTQSEA